MKKPKKTYRPQKPAKVFRSVNHEEYCKLMAIAIEEKLADTVLMQLLHFCSYDRNTAIRYLKYEIAFKKIMDSSLELQSLLD